MLRQVSILLVLTCVLVHISFVQGECCRTKSTLYFRMYSGTCKDVGGKRYYNDCVITICADGKRLVGTWCGRSSCNIFGCNCDKGCITGNWKQSFLDNNRRYMIHVTDQTWS